MARKLDSKIGDILKKYGADPMTACWDCHGVWVVYHKALEEVAAKAGITFDAPQIIEASADNKTVSICVTGKMGDRTEWSFGEAAPGNNKNAYPYAMAEKRGKDRVILKLVGLSGLTYSEEEADDFKGPGPAPETPKNDPGVMRVKAWAAEHLADLHSSEDGSDFIQKLEASKGHWIRVCGKYPGVWVGPERTGLVNDGASAASIYEVRDSYDTFIQMVEAKAADAKDAAK